MIRSFVLIRVFSVVGGVWLLAVPSVGQNCETIPSTQVARWLQEGGPQGPFVSLTTVNVGPFGPATISIIGLIQPGPLNQNTSHLFDFGGGDTISTNDVSVLVEVDEECDFLIQGTLSITGGTGSFVGASGSMTVSGSVQWPPCSGKPVAVAEVVYEGEICLPAECDDCDGKVIELTLRYLGNTANANVEVFRKQRGRFSNSLFSGIVQPGGTFTFFGNDRKGTMGPDILVQVNGVDNARIHTSCSQPIGPGLIRGDFEVVSGQSRFGGLLCPLVLGVSIERDEVLNVEPSPVGACGASLLPMALVPMILFLARGRPFGRR